MQINIEIKNRKASAQNFAVIRENSDYIVKFDFDAEWDGVPLKTARFVMVTSSIPTSLLRATL